MAKTKKTAKKATTQHISASVKPTKHNTLLILTLVLVVFQLIVLFGILFNFESKLNDSTEKLSIIESKVNAIDGFFVENVQGYNSGAGTAGAKVGTTTPTDIDIVDEPTIGNVDAPVTIIEFSDYECPFCGKWHSESYENLKKDYIDTGLVKLVFKDFPLSFHDRATPTAIAANCVQAQLGNELYFEYHNTLFSNQQVLTDSNLKSWAVELGVDANQFDTCVADPTMTTEVQEDFAEGASLGVSGTPSFFINGNLVVGAQPYSVIKQAIDAELK